MTPEELQEQNDGLRRRIAGLEKQNAELTEAVRFTLATIELCKDKTANPLAKMIDRERAEKMMAEAIQ